MFEENRENSQVLLRWALLLSAFCGAFEIGASSIYRLFPLSLIPLVAAFAFWILNRRKKGLIHLAGQTIAPWRDAAIPLIWILSYLLWDGINLLYAPIWQYGWEKYRVVLPMLFVSLCLVCVLQDRKGRNGLLLIFTGAGMLLSIGSVVNYLVWRVYPLYYTLRLTLRRDYNMFATAVLLGMLSGYGLIVTSKKSYGIKTLLLGALTALELPVLYLSGSRRTYLLLLLFLPLFLLLFSIDRARKDSWKQALTGAMALVLGVGALSFGEVFLMEGCMNQMYQQQGEIPELVPVPGGETTVGERYDTTTDGSALDKRLMLWRIAWEDYRSSGTLAQTVGQGLGYDILLYDLSDDPELAAEYPDPSVRMGVLSAHNMLLTDLLSGGWIKGVLLVGMLLALAWRVLLLIWSRQWMGFVYGCILFTIVAGNGVSNRFGLLYDKFFYFYVGLTLWETISFRRDGGGEQWA